MWGVFKRAVWGVWVGVFVSCLAEGWGGDEGGIERAGSPLWSRFQLAMVPVCFSGIDGN